MKLKIDNLNLSVEAEISDGDAKVWAPELSDKAENNFNTIMTYRRKDGRIFMQIVFGGLTNGSYTNYTLTNYDSDGIAVLSANTYDIPVA